MLTFKPKDCEAAASMSLFQSSKRGAIHTCSVSAAIATKPHTVNTDHHNKRTAQA
jgi:hypothetical protein